jgi:ABC-type multidrug transport system ATPase subunit
VRGVSDVKYNVSAVIRAVGLQAFSTRMAEALSGGNKRKLSLGIALMGNPTVVLLDEPSSGLDAAAKRIMWNTLKSTVAGRSMLLTTHSMEEADALAGRVGILAKSMLALGTIDELRARFGNIIHVHLVHARAPHSSAEEMERVRAWVQARFPEAEVEENTYHGQKRFSVPAGAVDGTRSAPRSGAASGVTAVGDSGAAAVADSRSAIGRLVVELEERKAELDIEHFSVSPTTLDKVFLMIVGEHNVQEENY